MNNIVLAASSINDACGLLGCDIYKGSINPGGINDQLVQIIKFGISAIFLLIIIFGIFLIIKAAITIINSNGDAGKVEEGSKAIKGVFIGIGIIFVGIIGIIIILVFFGAGGVANTKIQGPNNLNIPILTN